MQRPLQAGTRATRHPHATRKAAILDCVQLLNEIFRTVDVFSKQSLKTWGVSGPQLWALRQISESGTIAMGELAERMHLHVSTVTGIVDRLERSGLAKRSRSMQDERVRNLEVTPKGRRIVGRAPEPPRSVFARGLQRLGTQDLRRVLHTLALIATLMGVPPLP